MADLHMLSFLPVPSSAVKPSFWLFQDHMLCDLDNSFHFLYFLFFLTITNHCSATALLARPTPTFTNQPADYHPPSPIMSTKEIKFTQRDMEILGMAMRHAKAKPEVSTLSVTCPASTAVFQS